MGGVWLIGNTHTVSNCSAGLFPNSPITVSKRAVTAGVPPHLCMPLVAHTPVGKGWKHDTTLLLKLVTLGKSGIVSLDAFAALFLAWAHHQTLNSSKRTVWPARTKKYVLAWAQTQAWVTPGCGLGANGELCLLRASQNKHVKAAELLATAAPQTRTFLLTALGAPAARIVEHLPHGSQTHFFAPELWLMDKRSQPYAQTLPVDNSIAVPTKATRDNRTSALLRCCIGAKHTLTAHGIFKLTELPPYCRQSPYISVDGHPANAPYAYVTIGQHPHIVWTRAAHAVTLVANRTLNVVLCPSVYPDAKSQKITVADAAIYAAEHITWAEIQNLAVVHKLTTIKLCGHTPTAISSGQGPTWLDLLSMEETTIDTAGLKPHNAIPNTRKTLNAAIQEDMLIQLHKGTLPCTEHHKICSPAPLHTPDTLIALRAAANLLAT